MSNRNNGNANLKPFTNSEEAAAAGRRSGEARRAKREAKQLAQLDTPQRATNYIQTLATTLERDNLGPAALATAATIIARIATGHIEVDGRNAAELIRVLVDVGRIEGGEVTSAHLSATASAETVLARVQELRASNNGGNGGVIEAAEGLPERSETQT